MLSVRPEYATRQLDVNADKRALVLFFGLAYAIAWMLWLPLVLSQNGLGVLPVKMSLAAAIPGAFAPCLAAYITQRWSYGNWRAVDWIQGWRRAWIGILLGPLLLLVGQVVIPALLLANTSVADLHWRRLLDFPLAVVNPGILLTRPLGEGPGWRGYALPKLQGMVGPFRAARVLGLVWAMWHLPLFLVKGWTSVSIPVFLMILVGWSIIITCVFNWSGGSVVVAILAHSAGNAGGRFMGDLLAGVPIRDGVSGELVIALSLFSLAALLTVSTRGRLGKTAPENKVDGTQEDSAQEAEPTRCSEPGDDAPVDNQGSAAPGR